MNARTSHSVCYVSGLICLTTVLIFGASLSTKGAHLAGTTRQDKAVQDGTAKDIELAIPKTERKEEKFLVPLEIVPGANSWFGMTVAFQSDSGKYDQYSGEPEFAQPGETLLGQGPSGLRVKITRVADAAESESAYDVIIDTDGDGDLANEETHRVNANTSVEFELVRAFAGETRKLPFALKFDKRAKEETQQFGDRTITLKPAEHFIVFARHTYEGTLEADDFTAKIVAWDMNCNGQLDTADFKKGTALSLQPQDSRAQALAYEEPFHFAGRFLAADLQSLDAKELKLTFATSPLPDLAVGKSLGQALQLQPVQGDIVSVGIGSDKLTVIDFWASWCSPCVEKLPAMKQLADTLGDEVQVLYYAIDEPNRTQLAQEIAARHKLPEQSTITPGRGDEDPVWRMFGRLQEIGHAIPGQVVIDAEGKIVFAGKGDIAGLRAFLQSRLSAQQDKVD